MNWLGLCLPVCWECVTGTSSSHCASLIYFWPRWIPEVFQFILPIIVHFTTIETQTSSLIQITLSFITLSTMYSVIVWNSNLHWMSKWAWTQLTSCLPTTPNSHSIDESILCNLAESCLCLRYWGCLCRHCNVWWEARHHSACWSVKHT